MPPFHMVRQGAFRPQVSSAQPQNLRPTFPATLQLPVGVTENRVTGRTEGNPYGIVVNHALNTGGTVHNNVDTPQKLTTALQLVAASLTNDVIVLTGDFTLTPTYRLPLRQNENLRCDIVSAAVFAGTFPRGVDERVLPTDSGLITLTRGLTADGSGLAMLDTGANQGVFSNLASGYRFIGIKFTTHPSQTHVQYQLINMGHLSSGQNAIDKIPQNIIFDRCVIDGGEFCQNKFGLFFAVRRSSVRNCYIYRLWARNVNWDDVGAIVSWNTDGGNLI
jgi:hypothetical protein